ncbi:MAG: hypothetical protein EZS28_014601 [Streblomastix strix]|uniref:Hemerythrin-like domain-containing protein n=1 Tax=Streblomastix strix TaxID=222440 RepID=A0A5J4W5N6_9EUKA|nr:MAG: hypothetical protein EZS28_014601 [Streblomastix strix]
MFNILTQNREDEELDVIYEEASEMIYPLLLQLNQEYHKLYEWSYYRQEWRSAKAIWNEIKLQNITVGKIGIGPDMKITNSTTDELRLTRFIQWAEDAINVMLQLFTYKLEKTPRERRDFYTMKQQLAVLALNVPFAATEEMKLVAQAAHKEVLKDADFSIIIIAICLVLATLIMSIGLNIPIRIEISKIIKDRKAKIRVLCNIPAEEAQKMYTLMQDRNDPNERMRLNRMNIHSEGSKTERSNVSAKSGSIDQIHSFISGASSSSSRSSSSSEKESDNNKSYSSGEHLASQASKIKRLSKTSQISTKISKFNNKEKKKIKLVGTLRTMESKETGTTIAPIISGSSRLSRDNKAQISFQSRSIRSSRSIKVYDTFIEPDRNAYQNKDPIFEKIQEMKQKQQLHTKNTDHGIIQNKCIINSEMHPEMNQSLIYPEILKHHGSIAHPNIYTKTIKRGMMHDKSNSHSTAQYQILQQSGVEQQRIEGQIQGEVMINQKGMIVGANGEALMDQQLIEGQEYINEEEEEMKRIAEQRAEDVDEKLNHLTNIAPVSITVRMIIGTLLIVISVSSFYLVAIISLSSLSDKAAQITINEYRLVKVIQISAFSTMYVSNTVYRTNDTSMIVKIDKYTSAAFKDNSYALSEDNLRTVILSIQQILNTLTSKFQFGPDTLAITGDPLLDAFHVPRMQGKDSFVDEIFQGSTDCLFVNTDTDQTRTDVCNNENRLPGMQFPFNGLEQLLVHFHLCVQDIMNKDPTTVHGIDFENQQFQYVIESAMMDIKEGINRIGNYLVDNMESYSQQYNTILLVLFIVISILIIILSLIFFATLPIQLIQIADRTAHIELIGKVNSEEDIVVWSDDLNTCVKRIDDALHEITKTLSNVVRCIDYKEEKEIVIKVMDELIMQLLVHQTDEEELMTKYKFPSSLELAHKSAHVVIIRKVMNFHEQIIKNMPSVNDAVTFCSTLLPTHIHTQDSELALFLNEKATKDVLNYEIDFNEIKIPPSLDSFNNGPNTSMIEKIKFDKLIDRIKQELEERLQFGEDEEEMMFQQLQTQSN